MFAIIDNYKTFFIVLLLVFISMSCSKNPAEIQNTPQDNFTANNLSITEIIVGSSNTTGKYRMITFDIKWENIWTSSAADNWDAVWVFIKYKAGSGEWKPATLATLSTEHIAPAESFVTPSSDGKGVYIYHDGDGTGALNTSEISLKWNYGLDNVDDDAVVNIKVFGIEMVYIPEGSFYAGDNGYSLASFTKGSDDNRPWFITSENAIEVTNTASNGYYYKSSKDYWNETWNASEDVSGTAFTIPADFPKGYRAIYCMKYELTQQQYADFLNTLNSTQSLNRYDRANFNRFGYTISENNGVYSTAHPDRACGFLSPADGFAYADWAGIRPMSELEFEKICRGSGNPAISGEFAWGTTNAKNALSVNGTESDREYITTNGANSYYLESNFQPQFPLLVGIFAGPGKSREQNGAAYYGVMEMSTNLSETCVSIGNEYGRVFTYRNGDGQLAADGFTDESDWPLSNGIGTGYRGGCFGREKYFMQVSNREDATVAIDTDHRHIPLGFRGVRTVLF
ncbi:MAG: SUMF1/EgtB/PvdO family nonheme iron enzyme [Candidatus Neomarinimicrobiota bacterium]